MSIINRDTFTTQNKPVKRNILFGLFSSIECEENESVITLGGPTPNYNYESIKNNLGEKSKYFIVERDKTKYLDMMDNIESEISDSRVVPILNDVVEVLNPENKYLDSVKKINFIDLDFCGTIKHTQRSNLDISLKKLVKSNKLTDDFTLAITYTSRSGTLCSNLKEIKKTYTKKLQKNGWYMDYVTKETQRLFSGIFNEKFKKHKMERVSYRDTNGAPMLLFVFKRT